MRLYCTRLVLVAPGKLFYWRFCANGRKKSPDDVRNNSQNAENFSHASLETAVWKVFFFFFLSIILMSNRTNKFFLKFVIKISMLLWQYFPVCMLTYLFPYSYYSIIVFCLRPLNCSNLFRHIFMSDANVY